MRESFLSPSNFILPLFIHEESSSNVPIASMPGVFRLAYGKNVIDFVAEARSYGVNSVVIFPKVRQAILSSWITTCIFTVPVFPVFHCVYLYTGMLLS